MAGDTIFALSSGQPPAAIAVVRLSGPQAQACAEILIGRRPQPRAATLAAVHFNSQLIDNAIVLFFPGPRSQTGEDVVEFHLHGGRAVVAAFTDLLARFEGLRPAEPGEFTRRAFENGKLDLTGVEGLADLVHAETESQRRAALAQANGQLTRSVDAWQERLLWLAAQIEAILDLADEGEVGETLPAGWHDALALLHANVSAALARPSAERLRDGVRVVIAGPPNSGKSSLLNAMTGRDAAITSPVEGTTRDVIEAPVAIRGVPFLLVDTAGLRESDDEVEALGIARTRERLADADIILWLGEPDQKPRNQSVVQIQSKVDTVDRNPAADLHVSAVTGEGLDRLDTILVDQAAKLLPSEGEATFNARHRAFLESCLAAIGEAAHTRDPLIIAENLRTARRALDRITGRAGVDDMLDRLFAGLCVGK